MNNSGWDKAWIAPHDICPDCNGCGWDNPAQALYKCERCGGSGEVSDATVYAGERIEDQKPVPNHAPDGEKCWCGNYHPTDEDIGIYE